VLCKAALPSAKHKAPKDNAVENTAQHSTAQHSVMQHGLAQHGGMQEMRANLGALAHQEQHAEPAFATPCSHCEMPVA